MTTYCIADEDTVRGFRLAGVAGRAVMTAEQAAEALGLATELKDCGLIIVTDRVAAEVRADLDALRLAPKAPLIVEIPGPHGPMPGGRRLRQIVQGAVGVPIGSQEEH